MSEYQYYEFQAIDRPLTNEQLKEVRQLSKRAQLSATRAQFEYSYGDFPDEPLDVLAEYFDALLYIANWGAKQLAFRFPSAALPHAQLQPYLGTDEYEQVQLALHPASGYTILNFEVQEEEGYGWIEGPGLLDPLITLREAILQGDLRALYICWLRVAQSTAKETSGATLREPPVPPGLGQLDAPLRALIEFVGIDVDLVAAAAESSAELQIDAEPFEEWLPLLPAAERDAFLLRMARGEAHVGVELQRRLRELGDLQDLTSQVAPPQRGFADLQARVAYHRQLRVEQEKAEAERRRLENLERLAQHEAQIWVSIPYLLARRTGSGYDQAVKHLAEMRDLAVHRGTQEAFAQHLAEVIAPYIGSAALQRRLKEARLG